jgi:hypothetical protein
MPNTSKHRRDKILMKALPKKTVKRQSQGVKSNVLLIDKGNSERSSFVGTIVVLWQL